jgi:hypothetical protein
MTKSMGIFTYGSDARMLNWSMLASSLPIGPRPRLTRLLSSVFADESGRSDLWLGRKSSAGFQPQESGARLLKRSYPARLESSPSSACASAISGISGVGEKPSSARARMAWASEGRAVD